MTEETYRKWLEQLWANHGDQVFAYAARRVGTAHAEDVVADVFVVPGDTVATSAAGAPMALWGGAQGVERSLPEQPTPPSPMLLTCTTHVSTKCSPGIRVLQDNP